MADSIVTPAELLSKLAEGGEFDFFREAMLNLLRELMEVEFRQDRRPLGERTQDRLCQRNGYRERRLDTRVGSLSLPIPKLQEGSYFPSFLEPRRRSEEALLAVITEAYAERCLHPQGGGAGSGPRPGKHLQERGLPHLRPPGRAGGGLPGPTAARTLPYLFLDATYKKVRDESSPVVSMALVVAYGVAETGEREVVGLEVCRSEDYAFWRGFISGLVSRGLAGVLLVVSDAHQGLRRAIEEVFLGASWQRCRVHFLRNLLSLVPKDGQGMVLAAVRLIFQQPDTSRAKDELRALADRLAERLPGWPLCFLRPKKKSLPIWTSPLSTGSGSPPPTPWNG